MGFGPVTATRGLGALTDVAQQERQPGVWHAQGCTPSVGDPQLRLGSSWGRGPKGEGSTEWYP